MTDRWTDPALWLDWLWHLLMLGAAGPGNAARFITLATRAEADGAAARMVVLRGANREDGEVLIHTDARSSKIAELHTDPMATILVWEPKENVQVRLRARVRIACGAEARDAWEKLPPNGQNAYAAGPAPGTHLIAGAARPAPPDPARFAVLYCKIEEIDLLQLGQTHHRRVRFRRSEAWRAIRITP